jgi:hypothetical protein
MRHQRFAASPTKITATMITMNRRAFRNLALRCAYRMYGWRPSAEIDAEKERR